MGMYTEIIFRAAVKKDSGAIPVLKHLFDRKPVQWDAPMGLPDHPLFECSRWDLIGGCCSWYHHPDVCNSWVEEEYSDCITIFSRSDLKNYDSEIEKFFHWVMPYLEEEDGAYIGQYMYEEEDNPTIVHMGDKIEWFGE